MYCFEFFLGSDNKSQSRTLTRKGEELRRMGHTVHQLSDGEHHFWETCEKCKTLKTPLARLAAVSTPRALPATE